MAILRKALKKLNVVHVHPRAICSGLAYSVMELIGKHGTETGMMVKRGKCTCYNSYVVYWYVLLNCGRN
eukprot:scaffold24251_cov40-Attheya_sp.AAC.2